MPEYVKVAKKSELPEGKPTPVQVQGEPVALVRLQDKVYALHDICTHEEAPLSDGDVDEGELVCPWHGATFKLETGECTGSLADEGVKCDNGRVTGDDIEIEV